MKLVFAFLVMWVCVNSICSQTFTESAFFVSKSITDTSESIEALQTCNYTFDRLLKGTPADSSILFYTVLSQTKMAYLTLQSNPTKALDYIINTQAQLAYMDTTFHFGREIETIKLFQKIITLKASKAEDKDLTEFEKKIELFYATNKQSARANLVYAFYGYHFNKVKNKKKVESLLKTSIILFDREKTLNLPINWGKNLSVNLLTKVRFEK